MMLCIPVLSNDVRRRARTTGVASQHLGDDGVCVLANTIARSYYILIMCNSTNEVEESCHSQPPLVELSVEDVSYEPTMQTQSVQVLSRVSTRIRPYQLSAWMGPSGSM